MSEEPSAATMRALRIHDRGDLRGLALEAVPVPRLGIGVEDGARAFEAKDPGGIAGKVDLKVNADRSWVHPAGPVAQ